jgi:hypothetical protein
MKRGDLLRHLRRHGCVLKREGSSHSYGPIRGASFEIYGIAPTNTPYRYPILWGLHPADARLRPKWKQFVDEWCERVGVRPLFLPYGIQRTPVIAAKSPNMNQGGAANQSQPGRAPTNRTSLAAGFGR